MTSAITAISAAATLALAGSMAGLFYAFSVSVMPGLDRSKPDAAIQTMQSINRAIQNPVFLVSFLGAPVAAAATGALLLTLGHTRAAILSFLAAAAYLLGALAPTAIVNIPMNNALDATTVPADVNQAAGVWSDYSGRWTRWNTLRAVSCTISLLFAGYSLFVWGRHE